MRSGDRMIVLAGVALLICHLIATEVFRKPDGRVVIGDATHHYVQLRSLVYDQDLDFENDYLGMGGVEAGDPAAAWFEFARTPNGRLRNFMPVGPALLWMPLFVVVSGVLWLLAQVGLTTSPDGFDRVLQLVPGVMGVVSATIAALIARRWSSRFTSDLAAFAAVAGTWFGTHALYYTLVSPAYSHTASMLTASVFFFHWWSMRSGPTVGRFALSGAVAGLAALMRWQDAIFLVVPLIECARWQATLRDRLAGILAACAGFVLAFSPQMAVWMVLYDQPFAIPQGPQFMRWTSPHPWLVLFSDNHGLFSWTPLLLMAVWGLAVLIRRAVTTWLPIVAVVALAWYTNAAVADWWAGEAFGARRFLSLFPLFVVGLACWLEAKRPWRYTVITGLAAANLLLLLQYQLYMKGVASVAPYPAGWFDLYAARFAVPFRLLASWFE